MKNNFEIDNIKYMNKDEILRNFNSLIEKLSKKYAYVELSRDEINSLFIKGINDLIKNCNEEKISIDDISNYFVKVLNKKIIKKIKNCDYGFIINYFNNIIYYSNDCDRCIEELNKIGLFFSKLNYFPSVELISEILNRCPNINLIIENIYSNYSYEIREGNISCVVDNINAISFIDIYCMNNNIEIVDEDFNYENEISDVSDSMLMYLREIPNHIYTYEEQIRMFRRYRNGDEKAKNDIITHNLRLVVSIAKKFRDLDIELEELIQEGNLGLIKATEKYDYEKGYKFSTYATWWIRQYINRYISQKGKSVRIPVYLSDGVANYKKYCSMFEIKFGRLPSYDEISSIMGVGIDKIKQYEQCLTPTISLNQKISGYDTTTTFGEFIASEDMSLEEQIYYKDIDQSVIDFINSCPLDPIEKDIFLKRLGLVNNKKYTYDELGKEYNVSQERIRQRQVCAIRKIILSSAGKRVVEFTDDPDKYLEYLFELRKKYADSANRIKFFNINTGYKDNKSKTLDNLSLFKRIGVNKEEDIKFIMNEINEIEKSKLALLYKAFGESLDQVTGVKLTSEESRKISQIIANLKRKLAKKIQAEMFGDSYKIFYNRSYLDIKGSKSLYAMFGIRTIEEVELLNKIIENLPYDEKDLVYSFFGKSLGKPEKVKNITNEERKRLKAEIINKIRYSYFNELSGDSKLKNPITLFNKLEITREEDKRKIYFIVNNMLSKSSKELIYSFYGDDFNYVNSKRKLTMDEYIQLMTTTFKKILSKYLEYKNISYDEMVRKIKEKKRNISDENNEFNNINIDYLLMNMDIKERMILCLRLGYNVDKCYSTEDIAKLLNINKEEIINITTVFLFKLRDCLNNSNTLILKKNN